jgi:hypothetical protein
MISYEEIGFLNHTIYKIPMSGIDNQKVIKEIQIDRDLWMPDKRFNDTRMRAPGLQMDGQTLCGDETRSMFSLCFNKIRDFFTELNNEKYLSGYQRTWIYIAVPELKQAHYHNHLKFHPDFDTFTDWTWVYYVQVPDNCKGPEGKLFFRDDKDHSITHTFFPEEGYIYVFDANLEHLPSLSPNSTKERIVAAGNVILNFEN